jgi:hypothetical protein
MLDQGSMVAAANPVANPVANPAPAAPATGTEQPAPQVMDTAVATAAPVAAPAGSAPADAGTAAPAMLDQGSMVAASSHSDPENTPAAFIDQDGNNSSYPQGLPSYEAPKPTMFADTKGQQRQPAPSMYSENEALEEKPVVASRNPALSLTGEDSVATASADATPRRGGAPNIMS